MPRAVAFWRDTVGCRERFVTDGFSEVFAGDDVIALQLAAAPARLNTSLGVDVEDIESTCSAISTGGGEVTTPPMELVPGVLLAMAVDPDGNGFRLTQH